MYGLGGLGAPTFYDANNRPITSIDCGMPYTFDVPGYTTVWLENTFNGQPNYAGPLPLPMPSFVADCASQVGSYVYTLYELANGAKGNLIGQTTFQVLPAPSIAGNIASVVSGMSSTQKIALLAVGAAVVMRLTKGRS
jgi:hypothetical protein